MFRKLLVALLILLAAWIAWEWLTFPDVAALREENARLEFVTRYLNAVRAGSGPLSE